MSSTLNRRQFLGRSVAAGAAAGLPMIIPASALGAEGKVAPGDKITIVSIGVGNMGKVNLKAFLRSKDCQVVGICDTYKDRRELAKEVVDLTYENTDCATYADWREVVDLPDVDAVVISVQDHWHALIACAAMEAGKDVYCEKPLGVSIEESATIRDTVRKTKRVFQTGTWQRSRARFQQACRLARNGYLGNIHTVEVATAGPKYAPKYDGPLDPEPVPDGFDWEMWRGPAPAEPYNPGRVAHPDWYLIWDYSVGFICNWGVHHVDTANWGCPWIGSEPFQVEGRGSYRSEGFSDNIYDWDTEFFYSGGRKMIFKDNKKLTTGIRFVGDEGWVHVNRPKITAEPESLLKLEFRDTDDMLTESTNHQQNFLDCMKSRKDPVSNVDAAHSATMLTIVGDVAVRLEQPLSWDPKNEKFKGNRKANKWRHREMHNGWKL